MKSGASRSASKHDGKFLASLVLQAWEGPLDLRAFLADESQWFGSLLSSFNDVLPSLVPGWPIACLRMKATEHRQGGSKQPGRESKQPLLLNPPCQGQLVNIINEARHTLLQ